MATDFGALLATLKDVVHITDDTAQRMALVGALKHYRSTKFLCSERTAQVALVSGTDDYGPDQGLPGDILAINVATIIQGSSLLRPLDVVSIAGLRNARTHVDVRGYPEIYAFYGRKVMLYPGPGSSMVLQLDVFSDCARDEETGAEITTTTTSDAFTNPLIRDGEEMILARAAYFYLLGKGNAEQQARQWKVLEMEAKKSLLAQRDHAKLSGGVQVDRYL